MRNARALAQALPDARLVELPGCDSAIFSSDVDAVADEIEAFLTGTRPPPRKDRVLSTVLFTDIVGSTDTAAQIGDRAWRELLERHNRILRVSLDRFGGRECTRLAMASWRRSTRHDAPLSAPALPARRFDRSAWRSALAFTPARSSSRRETSRASPCTPARISALAGAGEVFVSSTVKDLVAGSGSSSKTGGHIG